MKQVIWFVINIVNLLNICQEETISKMSESKNVETSASSESRTEDSETIDPELDIRSERFNPLRALYAPEIYIPNINAPLYNNIAHYESATRRAQSGDSSSTKVAPKMPPKSYRQEIELHQRRFLPHQGMVKGKGKNARQTRNLLLKMGSDKLEGPLNVLKEWKVQRKRVKIYTRNVTTINGHATGFIEAFDKHWNIVLSDVFEVWKRKKFHYCPKAVMLPDEHEDEQLAECMQRLHELNITMPTVAVKSMNRKTVECSRNVPKLLIRGEQIATIILDSQTIKPETEIKSQPK